MYRKNCIVLFMAIFVIMGNLSLYGKTMKVPFFSNFIERRVSDAIEKVRPEIEKNAIAGVQKSSPYDDYVGMDEIKKMIVLASKAGNSPEQIFAKIWIAYRCVTMKANDIAALPFGLFKFDTNNAVEKHPVLSMLKGKANGRMSGYDVIERLVMHLELRGNAYGFFIGTPRLPLELWPLLAQNIRPIVNQNDKNEILYYRDESANLLYKKEQIIHIMHLNPMNTVEGISPLEAASPLTEFSDKTAEFKNYMYENQAVPSGVLEAPGDMTDSQAKLLRKEFDRYYSGVQNARRVMILHGGMKYNALGFNPRDMELLASEKLTWSMIPTAYGIPIELFGNLADQKNYANMREATKHYYLFGLLPTGKKIFRTLSMYFFPNMDYEFKIHEDQISALRPTATEIKDEYWTTPLEKRIQTGRGMPEDQEMIDQLNKLYFPGNFVPVNELSADSILNNPETL